MLKAAPSALALRQVRKAAVTKCLCFCLRRSKALSDRKGLSVDRFGDPSDIKYREDEQVELLFLQRR